jgi:hypothetical protein
LVLGGLALCLGPAVCSEALAEDGPVTFTVNSAEPNLSNASCSSPAQAGEVCTLRRAVELGNAVQDWDIPVQIVVEPGFSGTIPFTTNANDMMAPTQQASIWDEDGAFLWVKRPMSIDLDKRLHIGPANGYIDPTSHNERAAIWVDAPNVQLRNFTDWYSTQSAIVFSDNSDGSSLSGGSAIQTANFHTEREILILPGADGITIEDFTVGRMPSTVNGGGIVLSGNGEADPVIANVAIRNVTFNNKPADGIENPVNYCDADDARGCSSHGVNLAQFVRVDNLTVQGCEFESFGYFTSPINTYYAVGGSNWELAENTFSDIRTGSLAGVATITLPANNVLGGVNRIRDNTFDNTAESAKGVQGYAVSWDLSAWSAYHPDVPAPTRSNLFIENNRFDGYTAQSVHMKQTGAVTVTGNTFGPASASQQDPINEESAATGGLMYMNGNAADLNVRTWRPTEARLASKCELQVGVSRNEAGTTDPGAPVGIDFYWTSSNKAEEYLGRVDGVAQPDSRDAVVFVAVPDLPSQGGGSIRIQTHGQGSDPLQLVSSQYSRTIPSIPQVPSASECKRSVQMKLQAWAGVPAGVDSYQGILDSAQNNTGAVEVPSLSSATSPANVWFTYSVTNNGDLSLTSVQVSDQYVGRVCVIPRLAVGATAGCARRITLE